MEAFIQLASRQLDIGEDTVRSATGGLLKFINDRADGTASASLLGQLPGAAALIESAPESPGAGSGLMGGLGSMLGGNLGAAGGAMALVQQLGLDADKLAPFVQMFTTYLEEQAGADVVQRVLAGIPALKDLAG